MTSKKEQPSQSTDEMLDALASYAEKLEEQARRFRELKELKRLSQDDKVVGRRAVETLGELRTTYNEMGKPLVIWANKTTKVSQRDIVEATGFSNRTVANWVNDRKLSDHYEAIVKMAEASGRDPEVLRKSLFGDQDNDQ